MTQKFTAEEVRNVARQLDGLSRQMLNAYADTLSKPAVVPDGWADAYAAFKGAFDTPAAWLKDNSEYANDARKRLCEFNEAMKAQQPTQRAEGE